MMPTREEVIAKYGLSDSAKGQSRDDVAKKYGIGQYSEQPTQQPATVAPTKEEPGLLDVLGSYTTDPILNAIAAAQEGKGLSGFLEAGAKKLGEPSVPTVPLKKTLKKAGVSEKPLSEYFPGAFAEGQEAEELFRLKPAKGGLLDVSPAGILGGLGTAATDITTYAGGPILKGVGRGLGLAKEALAGSKLGKAVSGGVAAGKEAIKSAGFKVGETLTGIAKKDIETFYKKSKEILDEAKSFEGNILEATDATRAKWERKVTEKRRALNAELSEKLEKHYAGSTLDVQPAIDVLEKAKSKMHPQYDLDSITQLEDKIREIKEAGQHSIADAYRLKKDLGDLGKGAIRKSGQIFTPGSQFQKAAKNASAELNKLLYKAAPDVKKIDNVLSAIHGTEDKINKTILAVGKTEAPVLAAGSGANLAQRKQLGLLGKLTDTDMLADAEKLSAMRSFASPPLLPIDPTGKAVGRMVTGRVLSGLLGAGAGYESGGLPGAAMGLGGGALASPLMLKYGLLGAKGAGRVAARLATASKLPIKTVERMLETPQGRQVFGGLLQQLKE